MRRARHRGPPTRRHGARGCSQDDGAPPLWPWAAILRGLGAELPLVTDEDPGAPFRVREAIIGVLVEAARQRPLLLVLDDLHWADTASLRVLRLLAETVHAGAEDQASLSLVVLATWRNHPAPTGPLAEVAEALARRHATRLDLEGLDDADVGQLVAAVAHATPSADEALALRRRTDGNPFFLVEYARLANEGSDLARLVHEPEPPSAVTDVLVRRLDRLPPGTVATLRTAAVIGREFDLDTLAAALRVEPERALDDLDPALAAGLLRDVGGDRFRFAHALVRDAAYAGLAPSRRQRQHALVAAAVERAPGRESEVAHHWLAAGPAHADRAWPAAVAAAATASRLHAHEAGVELLRSALAVLPDAPSATARDRYDILMLLVESLRWGGDVEELLAAVEQAIVVADELGDVELLARAATGTGLGSLWLTTPYGVVFESIVAALRRCLDRLPAHDGALRCRVMMSLALETYYGTSIDERTALVDEALAMARRLGDDALLLEELQLAFNATWRPASAPRRLELATEARALASRLGDERGVVLTTIQLAIVCGELGRVDEMHALAADARREAERLRMNYALLVVAALELPWVTMAGRFEDAEALCAEVLQLDRQMSLAQGSDAVAASLLTLLVWRGGLVEAGPLLEGLASASLLPIQAPVAAFLIRVGAVEAARLLVASSPPDLAGDNWYSMLNWGMAAEAAFTLGLTDLAADAYERLAPFPGRVTSAGSANAFGPVDSFLALAAATVGELELATRHADRAAELCQEWEIPLAAQWLRDKRDRGGF